MDITSDQQSSRAKRRRASTVRAILPIQLARDETGRLIYPFEEMSKTKDLLFAALESFANLSDTIEDLRSFRQQYPGFGPVEIRPNEGQLPQGGLSDALHPLVRGFRDILRIVWRHGADHNPWCLDTLLGLNPLIYEKGLAAYGADPNSKVILSEEALRCIQPYRDLVNYSEIHALWRTGDFEFITAGVLHKAVYLLFKENWRAKICPQCARFFIADKPPQLYCSTSCYGSAKRKRDLNWWKKEGSVKRRAKRARTQGRQRKGGK